MASGVSVSDSGNGDIDALLFGSKWNSSNLTFSFPTSASRYNYPSNAGDEPDTFGVLTPELQTAVRQALAIISRYVNLTFTEITETSNTHADIRFGMTDSDEFKGHGYHP